MASPKERSAKINKAMKWLESGLWEFQTTIALNKEVRLETKDQSSPYLLSWLLNVNVFLAGFCVFPPGLSWELNPTLCEHWEISPPWAVLRPHPQGPGPGSSLDFSIAHPDITFLGALTGSLLHFVPLSLHLLIAEWRNLKYWQDCLCWVVVRRRCAVCSGEMVGT